jgi:undecaprenyl-diphosphatase
MTDLINALLLGIIEGITEFLPISSTGHLLIAEHWLGARSDLFNIAIQAGAIMAVVLIYWKRLLALLFGLREREHRDYVLKLILAFGVTAVLGLLVKKLGFELPETIAPVAWALLVGGFVMLGAEAMDARRAHVAEDSPQAISWGVAALVGVAQVVAGVFPGTSRSAAAIFAALLFGRGGRIAATEFAFLVGIPTMFAATGYELLHTLKDGGAASENWSALAVAFVVSALVAFAAVKWLLRYIQTHRFTVFAWYRILLGAALLVWTQTGAASPVSASSAQAAGRVPLALPAADTNQVLPAAMLTTRLNLAAVSAAGPTADAVDGPSRDVAEEILRFRAAQLCVQAAILRPAIVGTDVDGFVGLNEKGLSPADRQQRLQEARALLDLLDRADTHCASPGEELTDGRIYELALHAALAGDATAASCYAGGGFPISQATWERSGVQAQFRVQALRLIDRGIRQGDWRMVTPGIIAADPHRHRMRYEPVTPLFQPGIYLILSAVQFERANPQGAHALARLKQLGAPEGSRDDNQGFLDYTRRLLSVTQQRAADAWAADAFARYFHSRGWNEREKEPCPFE